MRYVVGVAGPAGGGKTTLVQRLVAALGDATAIYMDNYQRFTQEPTRRIAQWMERGADFDEFVIEALPEHLERLKDGREPGPKYLIFETHLGRAHRATGRFIDLLFWLDTPLDIALARNVKDLIAARQGAAVYGFVESYLADVRRLRVMQRERVAVGADVVLDGAARPEAITEEVLRAIHARLP